MEVQLISFERESNQFEKSLLLYAFISYPVKISVCGCSCCIEEWKKERMKSYVLNGYHQSPLKKHWQKTLKQNQFFSWKKQLSKKTLNVWNENILHPRKINVKCYIFFHHIKFTDIKKKYNSKYFSIFLWNIFKRCRGMPLQGHLLAARKI